MRAVATDGHRLARVELAAPAGSAGMPGVILPRKTVGEIQKLLDDGEADRAPIELSPAKVRFTVGPVVLTSKLIDGTFPDYARVIPTGNDKRLMVERGDFAAAVDRVSTISSERGTRREAVADRWPPRAHRDQPGLRHGDRGDRGRL